MTSSFVHSHAAGQLPACFHFASRPHPGMPRLCQSPQKSSIAFLYTPNFRPSKQSKAILPSRIATACIENIACANARQSKHTLMNPNTLIHCLPNLSYSCRLSSILSRPTARARIYQILPRRQINRRP